MGSVRDTGSGPLGTPSDTEGDLPVVVPDPANPPTPPPPTTADAEPEAPPPRPGTRPEPAPVITDRDRGQDPATPPVVQTIAPAREVGDLLRWAGLAALAVGLTVAVLHLDSSFAAATAPYDGSRGPRLSGATLLAPAVAALGLVATATRLVDRIRWVPLLVVGWLLSFAWAVALALVDGGSALSRGLTGPGGWFAAAGTVGDAPGRFLSGYLSGPYGAQVRAHPPLPVLLVWTTRRLGLHPVQVGLLLTLLGALVTPLVAVAVRTLCGEPAARRLVPVVALAPWAVWTAASLDAVAAMLAAAAVAVAAVGSRPGRPGPKRFAWATLCGLLLGTAALFSYQVIWLAVSVPCLYFVRRRPLLNVATGVFALAPLVLLQQAGFSFYDGLVHDRGGYAAAAGLDRAVPAWVVWGLTALLLAAGPALAASGRKIRLTPGWPFLVGAALAAGWALLAGLMRGEPLETWLPFLPWLVVAAVAPERRGGPAPRPLVVLTGAGAFLAILATALLRGLGG
jgi:methylthioxylose transferase